MLCPCSTHGLSPQHDGPNHLGLWFKSPMNCARGMVYVLDFTHPAARDWLRQASRGLQLQSLWRIPTVAVRVMAYSCRTPCGGTAAAAVS